MIIKYNNLIVKYEGKWLNSDGTPTPPHPDYNPLNLPPNTFRVRTNDGRVPDGWYDTATKVSGTTDIYDVYRSGTDLEDMFTGEALGTSNIVEVLGANTTGVTSMCSLFQYCNNLTTVALFDTSSVTDTRSMFYRCSSLTNVPLFDTSNVTLMSAMFYNCAVLASIPLFDTSNVTDMQSMFSGCRAITSVPLFDTSNVTNMRYMFYQCLDLRTVPLLNTSRVTNMDYMFNGCIVVESGALALYQQASTQTNPPSSHTETFKNCGLTTQTGSAELAQIPGDWK